MSKKNLVKEILSIKKYAKNIKNLINRKAISIPKIRNELIWDIEKKELFQSSLEQDLSIGTIIFYKYKTRKRNSVFILDGLQRTTVLLEIISNPFKYLSSSKVYDYLEPIILLATTKKTIDTYTSEIVLNWRSELVVFSKHLKEIISENIERGIHKNFSVDLSKDKNLNLDRFSNIHNLLKKCDLNIVKLMKEFTRWYFKFLELEGRKINIETYTGTFFEISKIIDLINRGEKKTDCLEILNSEWKKTPIETTNVKLIDFVKNNYSDIFIPKVKKKRREKFEIESNRFFVNIYEILLFIVNEVYKNTKNTNFGKLLFTSLDFERNVKTIYFEDSQDEVVFNIDRFLPLFFFLVAGDKYSIFKNFSHTQILAAKLIPKLTIKGINDLIILMTETIILLSEKEVFDYTYPMGKPYVTITHPKSLLITILAHKMTSNFKIQYFNSLLYNSNDTLTNKMITKWILRGLISNNFEDEPDITAWNYLKKLRFLEDEDEEISINSIINDIKAINIEEIDSSKKDFNSVDKFITTVVYKIVMKDITLRGTNLKLLPLIHPNYFENSSLPHGAFAFINMTFVDPNEYKKISADSTIGIKNFKNDILFRSREEKFQIKLAHKFSVFTKAKDPAKKSELYIELCNYRVRFFLRILEDNLWEPPEI